MMVKRDSMDACAILNVMGKFGESRCVILQQKVIQRQAQGVKRRVIHRCDLNTLVYDTAFMHPTLAAFPRRRMGTRKNVTDQLMTHSTFCYKLASISCKACNGSAAAVIGRPITR